MKILIYGYGNPGRRDDGLGVCFAEAIEKWVEAEGLKNITIETAYQLNIEDAEIISHADFVIFADASLEQIEDFVFTNVSPDDTHIEFTMHAVSTSFILDLCTKIFRVSPETWLMHIKGYDWELQEGVSEKAKINLEKAIDFAKNIIVERLRLSSLAK